MSSFIEPALTDLLDTYFHREKRVEIEDLVGLYTRIYPSSVVPGGGSDDSGDSSGSFEWFAPVLMNNLKRTVKQWTHEFVFNLFVYILYIAIQRKESVHKYIVSDCRTSPIKYQMQMHFVDLFLQTTQNNPFMRAVIQVFIHRFFTLDELLENALVRSLLQDTFE
jgi:hypothetical protein